MNILSNMRSWIGNVHLKTYNDAVDAWGEVARKGSAPADPNDILHQVNLAGGARLMAVRSVNGKVLAVISMD
jgi:hypothetical protein